MDALSTRARDARLAHRHVERQRGEAAMNAGGRRLVDLTGASWNRLHEWLTQVGTLRVAMHGSIPAG